MGSLLRFVGTFAAAQLVSYFLAGFLARAMGVDAYYPPSPTALSYLKSMDEISGQLGVIAVAQVFRGALFGLVISPFRHTLAAMSLPRAAAVLAGIVLVPGYVAASGGLIEHYIFFSEYPPQFALITLVEVTVQSIMLGLVVSWSLPRDGKTASKV